MHEHGSIIFLKRNARKYLQVWVTDLDWVSRRDRGLSHVFCHVCNSQFSVAAAGKNDAIRHRTTSQHENLGRVSSEQSCDFILCQPKGPGDHQAGDCCMNQKDQEITRRVTVVWTQKTRSPGGSVLFEPKGPIDHQMGQCCVNPKDQEITRRVILVWTLRTRR